MADQSLWEFLLNLLSDPEARAEFNADPEGTLREAGFEDVSPHDLKDAIDLVNDQSDVHYDAPEVSNDDVTAKEYIQTVINNVENHNYVDNSYYSDSSTNIEAGGDVTIDNSYDYTDNSIDGDGNIVGEFEDSNIATGENSIAGSGNTSVSGDGNNVGDGNTAINGDGDNTVIGDDSNYVGEGANAAFGGGDVTSTEFNGDVNVGDGSAFAAGGSSASVTSDDDFTDNSMHDSGNVTTQYEDAFNSNEESSSYEDNDSYSSSSDNDVEDHSSTVSAGHDVEIS